MARREPGDARRTPVEGLVVHRPAHHDWTFPKGKSDPGETLQQTAVREIEEEAGIRVRLGHPLQCIDYPVATGIKRVSYWCARQVGSDESTFSPNREVDQVRWLRPREAAELLTYDHDRALLEEFGELRKHDAHRTRTLVVLRHGKALARSDFSGNDLDRPLTRTGVAQAVHLAPVLEAYGVRCVVSSPALRCTQTVEPFAHDISTFLEIDDRLSEDADAAQVRRSVEALMNRKPPVTLCSHLPTLPWVFDAAGTRSVVLSPGEGVVVHHRKGQVFATERL
ncbi:MAG: NUDIX hydrolase [Cryobacterium sp.]|nr:NUDIX hydrolase [Cryobacterium sp.]